MWCCSKCGSSDIRLRGSSFGTGSWAWCYAGCGNTTLKAKVSR